MPVLNISPQVQLNQSMIFIDTNIKSILSQVKVFLNLLVLRQLGHFKVILAVIRGSPFETRESSIFFSWSLSAGDLESTGIKFQSILQFMIWEFIFKLSKNS